MNLDENKEYRNDNLTEINNLKNSIIRDYIVSAISSLGGGLILLGAIKSGGEYNFIPPYISVPLLFIVSVRQGMRISYKKDILNLLNKKELLFDGLDSKQEELSDLGKELDLIQKVEKLMDYLSDNSNKEFIGLKDLEVLKEIVLNINKNIENEKIDLDNASLKYLKTLLKEANNLIKELEKGINN